MSPYILFFSYFFGLKKVLGVIFVSWIIKFSARSTTWTACIQLVFKSLLLLKMMNFELWMKLDGQVIVNIWAQTYVKLWTASPSGWFVTKQQPVFSHCFYIVIKINWLQWWLTDVAANMQLKIMTRLFVKLSSLCESSC